MQSYCLAASLLEFICLAMQNYVICFKFTFELVALDIFVLILETWHCILIVFMIVELFTVVTTDTRDPLLIDKSKQDLYDANDLIFCVMCNETVLKSSYHCWRCGKCADNLDHHCKFLNCCIASANYLAFLRLLSVFILYSINFLVLGATQNNFEIIVIIILLATLCQLLLVLSLFMFHVYLNLCLSENTVGFIERLESNNKNGKSKPPIQLVEESHSLN